MECKLNSNRNFFLMVLGLVLLGGALVFALSRGWFAGDEFVGQRHELGPGSNNESSESAPSTKPKPVSKSLADSLGLSENELTEVGGVARPIRDLVEPTPVAKTVKSPLASAGMLPRLKGDENPQVAGVFQELRSANAPPEARSSMFLPEKFDKERYFDNPGEYVNKIRPGRAFAPSNPGPDVVPLAAVSSRLTTVLQDEKAILRVRAAEGYPVTFYTPDGGEFGNRLKTVTVVANKDGIAEAAYTAVSGTAGIIDVVAASPLHSGQVTFSVKVVTPD